MLTLLTPRVWNAITQAAASSTKPAQVAVAYFSDNMGSLLPLPKGSSLVVDASIATISAGATSPIALEKLRKRDVEIYTVQNLHAKVFAFDKMAFVGSSNVSNSSKVRLIEAVLQSDDPKTLTSIRSFVQSISLTRLSAADLKELLQFYKTIKPTAPNPAQKKFATLLMELTLEQGGGRETQVQPPKTVWENYFGITGNGNLPSLSLLNIGASSLAPVNRAVVKHHHTYTVEISGAELPRPAILQMRRTGTNSYSYQVLRPEQPSFGFLQGLLKNTQNPLWTSGRRWLLV
jgi:hypothetical protein